MKGNKEKGIDENRGIIYILTNVGMPGLIKIGRTKDIDKRVKELTRCTGVPFPFECFWAGEVDDCKAVEEALHCAFAKDRVNPKREFFELDPHNLLPLLNLTKNVVIITNDVNNKLSEGITEVEKTAEREYKRKTRPNADFDDMGISVGSKLVYTKDETIIAEVRPSSRVVYKGEEYSLKELTQTLLKKNYNIRPIAYWTYNGIPLIKIYNETYPIEDYR